MSLFDDDHFEEIVNQFFGNGNKQVRRRQIIKGEDDERNIDFIENKESVFLIFEFPGFNERDIVVNVNGIHLEIKVEKYNMEGIQTYLIEKLRGGVSINRELPSNVNSKKMNKTMRNGVLELRFDKK
jgi:HSP20 family molecular chaperone IbpA